MELHLMVGAADGWIGRWSPGIGDPTLMGWLTVCCYMLAAWLCYRVTLVDYGRPEAQAAGERWLWYALASGLFLLGINKQLDLQSAMTEMGRMVAVYQGWYETRREIQAWFIAMIGSLALVISFLLLMITRNMPVSTRLTTLGCLLLLAFVLIRAASFHHFDLLINHVEAGVRMNWLFEIGSILIISLGALWRAWSPKGTMQ